MLQIRRHLQQNNPDSQHSTGFLQQIDVYSQHAEVCGAPASSNLQQLRACGDPDILILLQIRDDLQQTEADLQHSRGGMLRNKRGG